MIYLCIAYDPFVITAISMKHVDFQIIHMVNVKQRFIKWTIKYNLLLYRMLLLLISKQKCSDYMQEIQQKRHIKVMNATKYVS